MDGSNAAFLLDSALLSPAPPRPPAAGINFPPRPPAAGNNLPPRPRAAGGILYVEDFDTPAEPAEPPPPATAPEPAYVAADLAAAREAGRAEGLQAALEDAATLQAALQTAALQSVADGLAAARAALDNAAGAHAIELSRAILAVLAAALPATMRHHARTELAAMIQALLPGLICMPELRVRTHPDLADALREILIAAIPPDTCVLSVCADPARSPGDVSIAWQDGHATRDCRAIWSEITAVLSPLGLPHIEDICRDIGS